MTTTAKLAGSKLAWIDEQTADTMFHRLGSHHLAIVELKVDTRTEKDDDQEDHQVTLKVTNVTLAANSGELDTHLRELQRADYMRRKHGAQLPLDDTEVGADEIIRRGKAVLLTCQTCLHENADERIRHYQGDNPDDENAWCTWAEDGTQVYTDDDRPGGQATCRECGCTDAVACEGGCSWTEPDLCSACYVAADAEEPDPETDDTPGEPDRTPTLGNPFAAAT